MSAILGHGIDLVQISRIAHMIEDHGEHFIQRVFAPAERFSGSAAAGRVAEHYAVRFACKEAVVKALGTGFSQGIALREIQVHREPSGRPIVKLTGRCQEIAAALGITQWHISLTHTADYAMASAIAVESAEAQED